MGQRHQLFVIAKIANRYRGLAVFHHQWLYGAAALKRCLGLLAIFSASPNRLPIQQELAAARRYDEDFWTKPRSYNESEVPFPFISTCLLLGASFDAKEGNNATLILEPFNMAFDGGDNNDGITVIDITNLSHVRYCFVIWDKHYDRGEEQLSVPRMTPLSGPTYLGAYYDAEERSKNAEFRALMQKYDYWELIDVDTLANTWPQGEWPGTGIESAEDADIATAKPTPSLRESALARLVETSLQKADSDISWITEAELLPDFLPAVRTRLASEPTLIDSSLAAKAPLLKAIEHEQEVDLSVFQNLSAVDLSGITSRLSEIVSLCLSGPNVSAGLLDLDLPAATTSLRKLYVLDAPNLQLLSVLRLMHKPGMPRIYHADMFRRPVQYRLHQHHHLSESALLQTKDDQSTPHQVMDEQLNLPGNPTPRFPVVQVIWLSREFNSDGDVSRLGDGGLPWPKLLPDQEQRFCSLGPFVAAFPLRDAFLPTTCVVTGLVKFMQYLINTDLLSGGMSHEGTIAMAAAKSFALAASDLREMDTAKQLEVGPLAQELFTTAKEMLASSAGPPAPEVREIKPGEWTIIIVHEAREIRAKYEKRPSEERLRYAFISAPDSAASGTGETASVESDDFKAGRAPGEVILADMGSFLERVITDDQGQSDRQDLLKFWDEATKGLADEFRVCGKEEIASVLEVMPEYSKRREPQLNFWHKWSGRGR